MPKLLCIHLHDFAIKVLIQTRDEFAVELDVVNAYAIPVVDFTEYSLARRAVAGESARRGFHAAAR